MNKYSLLVLILSLLPIICFAEQIDINSATLSQLDGLTGIGPAYAQRIIDGRPYSSIDDLDRVKGIGPATLQKIKDQGLACVNCETSLTAQTQPALTPPPTMEPTPAIVYPSGVFINEIMPNPQGADETEEWVELYNSNNFDVDLSGWQLQDINGTVSTFIIPTGSKILVGSFLVFERPETKIMLNNDTDGLMLLTPDKKTEDSINFASAPLGQSYNKIIGVPSGAWGWSTTPTPGAKNIVSAPAPKTLSKAKNSVNNKAVEPALADISQILNTNQDISISNPWFLFLSALAITIISAVIVLLIKTKLHVRT